MGYAVQVAIDCSAPHPLADWWALTLGWEVESSDEGFIQSMLDQGFASADDTMRHNGALVWKAGAAITDPHGPPGTPRVFFQLVPEPKTGKNRLHLDVRVADDLEGQRTRLEERGATFLHGGQQGPHSWITMADPEGNEFCITM